MNSKPGTTMRTSTHRLPVWDNARFLAVTLVIVGHALQRLTYDSQTAFTIYITIYAFHIPLFLLISGYFSKSDSPTLRSMTRIITDLIVPYFILELIWSVVKWLSGGQFNFDPTRPSWTLWFLVTLAAYKILLPYLALLRWPLLISIVVSVGAGYLGGVGNTLSLARTLGFLPFFIIGWKISNLELINRWLTLGKAVWWVRVGAAALFIGAATAIYLNADLLRSQNAAAWLYYKSSYESLGADSILAGVIRLGLIVVALVLGAAFLALVPRRTTVFTSLGAATMYIYLLHTFVLYPLRESSILSNLGEGIGWIALLILGSVLLSFALSSKPVLVLLRPIIQPRVPWLLAATTGEGSASLPTVSAGIDRTPRDS